jgi:hypothetical protein
VEPEPDTAPVLHGAISAGQSGSRQDQVFAGKAKKKKKKKSRKKICELQPLAIGSEGVAGQQPGGDLGLPVISTAVGGVIDGGGGGNAVEGGEQYPYRYVCDTEEEQLVRWGRGVVEQQS